MSRRANSKLSLTMTTASDIAFNIMVVDDDSKCLALLEAMLSGPDLRVRLFPRGRLALAAAQNEAPDLILLDVAMAEMDGYEVCRHLKAHPLLKEIPVLFISGKAEILDKVEAFAVGGVDYVTKPFEGPEVVARVRTHLELQRQRKLLRESYERLKELEQLRDSLTHMIVHDLRNPLMTINGNAYLLEHELGVTASADARKYLGEMRTSLSRLADMVSSVLDVNRMEAGEMPLNRDAVDLVELVEAACKPFMASVGDRQLRIERVFTSVQCFCDAELIQRVVSNLMTNALKYAPSRGEICITVSADASHVRVAFADTGPGIAKQDQKVIFEKYGQADSRRPRYSSGLGLAFCKLAVEAHGGQIGVESELGRGSRFWFSLPA